MDHAIDDAVFILERIDERWPALANSFSAKEESSDEIGWRSSGKEARFLSKLRRLLGKANEQDRKIVLFMAQKMAVR